MRRADRDVFGVGTMLFAALAMMLGLGALIVAGQAWSRANDAKDAVAAVARNGALARQGTVTLQEFQILPRPTLYKAGPVKFTIRNVGSMTHEMVLLRAPSVDALPKVTVAGGARAVGDIDEAAISGTAKMGETGDVKPGTTVVKTFRLTPGTYVMICNIDDAQSDGTVVSHFQKGMSATITAG